MDILIDFDGTVVTHEYPNIGEDIGATPVLHKLINNGHNLILFTMRSGDKLNEAVNWFKEHSIPLYGIQKHPTQHTWTTSPKAYGQLIIDDTALGIPLVKPANSASSYLRKARPYVDWAIVEEILINKGLI